jgi:hypothetical protein
MGTAVIGPYQRILTNCVSLCTVMSFLIWKSLFTFEKKAKCSETKKHSFLFQLFHCILARPFPLRLSTMGRQRMIEKMDKGGEWFDWEHSSALTSQLLNQRTRYFLKERYMG